MIADMIPTAEITACLANGTAPVCPPVVVSGWTRKGEDMSAVVTFGPFLDRVSFSTVLAYANGGTPRVCDASPDGLQTSVPGGTEYSFLLTIDGSEG